jgi:hypothetical protein
MTRTSNANGRATQLVNDTPDELRNCRDFGKWRSESMTYEWYAKRLWRPKHARKRMEIRNPT